MLFQGTNTFNPPAVFSGAAPGLSIGAAAGPRDGPGVRPEEPPTKLGAGRGVAAVIHVPAETRLGQQNAHQQRLDGRIYEAHMEEAQARRQRRRR